MSDKITESLVLALKQAMNEPGEQRLFKSGKLNGLFASRAGWNGEAASRALSEGMLEVVRTEAKGKSILEWVRLTPRGLDFLHNHQSPVQALEELRGLLQISKEATPVWLGQIEEEIREIKTVLTETVQRWSHRLEILSQRVEEALRRSDAGLVQAPNGTVAAYPWALAVLNYLDRRQTTGAVGPCPLSELFRAAQQHFPDLTLVEFHEGIRHLQDRRALHLHAFEGTPQELSEPEYALLDGSLVLVYASR